MSPSFSEAAAPAAPGPLSADPAISRRAAQTGTLQWVPQDMIDAVLPEVITADYHQCQGGDVTHIGHPIEMIKVDSPWPAVCKYCGLRYINNEMAAKTADWSWLVGVRPFPLLCLCMHTLASHFRGPTAWPALSLQGRRSPCSRVRWCFASRWTPRACPHTMASRLTRRASPPAVNWLP